jgi:hypothetical protein
MAMRSEDAALAAASERARGIRELYHRLELDSMGRTWTVEQDMLGLVGDVGLVSRLVLAAEGTWPRGGDVPAELQHKLAECLWWILVLSDRLGIDISETYEAFADRLESDLGSAVDGIASESDGGVEGEAPE